MTYPVPDASGSPRGSLSPIPNPNASASDVNDVAQNHFSTQLPPLSKPLHSGFSEETRLRELYQYAYERLETNPETARYIFSNLIRDIPKDDANFPFLVECKTGLSLTYPEASNERKQAALDAKKEPLLKGPALENKAPFPTDSPRKVIPKVTKKPVDSWKTARLFIAFGFAAAFFTGAFVLGRRYITQLNFPK